MTWVYISVEDPELAGAVESLNVEPRKAFVQTTGWKARRFRWKKHFILSILGPTRRYPSCIVNASWEWKRTLLSIGATTWRRYVFGSCHKILLRLAVSTQTVEIDESLFSKRKNHAGRVLPQQWVFGGICRETKECFMVLVPDRTAATLMPLVEQYIRPGSTIISDQWRAYLGIQAAGFPHETVIHSRNFVDPDTLAHTKTVKRLWKSAKERNKRQCGTNRGMMDSYMAEFLWRHALNGRNPFDVILEDIAAFFPLTNWYYLFIVFHSLTQKVKF